MFDDAQGSLVATSEFLMDDVVCSAISGASARIEKGIMTA